MPAAAKLLFRPSVLGPRLAAFQVPERAAAARERLSSWVELLASPRAERLTEAELLPDFLTDVFYELLGYAGPSGGVGRHSLSRERRVEVDGKYADARRVDGGAARAKRLQESSSRFRKARRLRDHSARRDRRAGDHFGRRNRFSALGPLGSPKQAEHQSGRAGGAGREQAGPACAVDLLADRLAGGPGVPARPGRSQPDPRQPLGVAQVRDLGLDAPGP